MLILSKEALTKIASLIPLRYFWDRLVHMENKMTILVVDDDLLAAEMTSAILEASGYQTLIAENAIEGMELLNQHSDILLVVSDLNMPLDRKSTRLNSSHVRIS